jgi:hypothetical protein
MLKKIALGGFVLLALAFSLSVATATTSAPKGDQKGDQKGMFSPQTPIPQGFCLPPGVRC